MKRISKFITAGMALAFAATTLPVVTPAEAGKRHWRGHHHHHHYHRRSNDSAVAAGIFGLAAGALLGSALSQPRYYSPPPPAYYPAPVRYVPAPWTPEWYAYCDSKYVSFDHASGTFMGYDGIRRICQ